jgi:alcohol oxidase
MQYVRASASDYDDWKTVHGNHGWGSDELIPLLRKVSWLPVVANLGQLWSDIWTPAYSQTETYQIAREAPTHGTDGPLKVSESSIFLDFGHQYLQVVGELDPARTREPPDTDTNDLKTINVYAVGLLLCIVSQLLPIAVSYAFYTIICNGSLSQKWPKYVYRSPSRAHAWVS